MQSDLSDNEIDVLIDLLIARISSTIVNTLKECRENKNGKMDKENNNNNTHKIY